MTAATLAAAPHKIAYGRGVYVYDTTGKQYIDGSGGPTLFCIGHGHPEVGQAIKDQIDRIAYAKRRCDLGGPGEQKVSCEDCHRVGPA